MEGTSRARGADWEELLFLTVLANGRKEGMKKGKHTHTHTQRSHHMGYAPVLGKEEERSDTVSLLEVGQDEKTHWLNRANCEKKRGPAGYFWVVEESAKLPVQTTTCPKGKPGCIHPTELFSPASTYPEQTSTGGPTASPGATFRSLELEKGKSPSHLLKKEQENPYCIIGEGCICPKKYCK